MRFGLDCFIIRRDANASHLCSHLPLGEGLGVRVAALLFGCGSAALGKLDIMSRLGVALAVLTLASGCAGLRGGAPVVRGDRVDATIVIADTPCATAREAAEILRDIIEQMTGQTLSIVTENEAPADGTLLAVGATGIAVGMGVDVPRNRLDDDQYVIRRRGRALALVGNDGGEREGSIYAVYDLLQRWGCGWYGPDPEWHVIPQRDHLRVPDIDIEEKAAFDLRRIHAVAEGEPLGRAWRLGGLRLARDGHTLNALVPRRLREDHPDWFYSGQPDICHPEVIDHVVEQFKERLGGNDGFQYFDIGIDDAYWWPDSEYTRAVGNPGAQLLYFANSIADRLRPAYEGRFAIGLSAGGVTHEPPDPELDAVPGVLAFFGNESNRTKPWDEPDAPDMADFLKTQVWIRRHFHGWRDTGVELGIHDRWMPGVTYREWRELPWIALETTVRNTRYWKQYDVRHVDIETDHAQHNSSLFRWPLYYIGARALWDPHIDPDEALRDACVKLFGPAAQDMFAYYKTLERAMFETPYFQQNRNLPPPEKIYTPEIRAIAGKHLAVAAERADGHEAVAARISRETELWEKAAAILDEAQETPRVLYRAYVDDKFMFWHEPEATVGTIRRLFGMPNHVALYILQTDTDVETRLRKADTIDVIRLTDGARLVTDASDIDANQP